MAEFKAKSLCILGRQAKLGLAELESLYGAEHLRTLSNAAILDIDTSDISFKRLGGTIKLALVLTILPTTKWQSILQYLTEKIPEHMQHQPAGKFTLGLSIYGLPVSLSQQTKGLMAIKRVIRSTGKSVRIVPNKTATLNSAQVLHNKLTTKGAWELLLVRDGLHTILAQTIFVQDIEAYGARDQARPARDARVGMLPPKLAQIMINLANPFEESTILDPFCGTGVVLQEALLMNYKVVGTDIDPRMVDYSQKNLDWLSSNYKLKTINYKLELGDATTHKWPENIGAVVSEINLGKPLSKLPASEELYKIAGGINDLLKKFLQNLGNQITPGTRLCLAVPAWRAKNGFVHLPIVDTFDSRSARSVSTLSEGARGSGVGRVDHLTDMGYNQLDFKNAARKDLIYFRPDQIVARQLIVIARI